MGGGDGLGRPRRYAATRPGAQAAIGQDRVRPLSEYSEASPRVFISFTIGDEAQVNLLRHQAKNSDKLEFVDYSVKEPFDEKWKTQCTERLKQCSVVVVAIGELTHERPAVLWEIQKAHELGKPVIGMRIYSDKNHEIPELMREYADKVVPWNLEALQKELDKIMKKKRKPNAAQ